MIALSTGLVRLLPMPEALLTTIGMFPKSTFDVAHS